MPKDLDDIIAKTASMKKPGKKAPAKTKVKAKAKAGVRKGKDQKASAKPADEAPTSSAGFKFPRGNKFWQCRAKHGRDGIWESPEDLLNDCMSYFEWLEENPLYEEKGFAYQGVVTKEQFYKMRAATLDGLQLHLGISDQCWRDYRKRPDFIGVVDMVEKAIRQQKFAGAAADLLNANIIARDLGLKDSVQTEHTGKDGKPIEMITADMDPKRASEVYRELIGGRTG